jgi:hypothetical protein
MTPGYLTYAVCAKSRQGESKVSVQTWVAVSEGGPQVSVPNTVTCVQVMEAGPASFCGQPVQSDAGYSRGRECLPLSGVKCQWDWMRTAG